MKSTMLERLRHHFDNTDQATLEAQWAEIDKLQIESPNAFEYLAFLNDNYSVKLKECETEKIKISQNMTSNFSGSFFYRNIAV